MVDKNHPMANAGILHSDVGSISMHVFGFANRKWLIAKFKMEQFSIAPF